MTIEITPEEHIQILKALHSKKLLLGKKIRWGSKKASSFKQQAGCLKMYTYPAPPYRNSMTCSSIPTLMRP